MAIKPITTGEQTVTATGAVTGTLDTSTITGDYTVKVRVRDLTTGKKVMLAVEDTAGATPFTDAQAVAVCHFGGATGEEDTDKEFRQYDIPSTLTGGTNNKLRINVYRIDSAATCFIEAWVEA
jgi:hypothetical protein